ncbi:MAG: MaoC family dehydratase [Bryobacterales bacterium]|nr:MaoC family dehydratase [Bryobacterales bacterium]MDE0625125.1 MaoC family dehydratase [Bryobacterales bacterium]
MPKQVPVDEFRASIGAEIAVSDWFTISQDRIDNFADTTEDHQWIHVDVERARTESPFKTTIGHGFLSLSMLAPIMMNTVKVAGDFKHGINYGLNRVRFPSPVPAGSRIRGRITPHALDEHEWGVQTVWQVYVELEHSPKPCVVAEWVTRAYR